MARSAANKHKRHQTLIDKLKDQPFLTDEELCEIFGVSIQTIRLDRLELGIPELRERIKAVAKDNYQKVKTVHSSEIVGELIDIELGRSAISVLHTDKSMAFSKTSVVKGHHIYSLAESLAIAVIDAEVALTGVANIKYKSSIKADEKLVARAEVIRTRANKYFVHVKIKAKNVEVFRGKFILVSIIDDKEDKDD